jgi:eukaryotic-like serine/threonine-protein kinase
MSSFGETVFAGRYRVIRRLGAGGSAAVFLTRDERLGRDVALKRLHGAEVTAQTALRLQREARIMASLRHPHLVTVYDMLMDEDDLLLVMEYVRGETLAGVLTSAPLDWERTLELLEPVASALDHVHDRGVVHRDLKPSNILVGTAGVVKVADLGLATAAEITKITPPGAILGTPAYMAPEQARPGPCTAAVDVYAFASIAFQALSGTLPRPGRTVVAVLKQAMEPPPDLRARLPTAPAAAAEALVRGMSPKPAERQRSASELLEELAAAFGAGAVEGATAHARDGQRPSRARPERLSRPVPLQRPRPRQVRNLRARLLAIGALAGGVAAVLVFVAALQNDRTPPPDDPPPAREPALTAIPMDTATAAPTANPAAPRALSATATVRAFYRRAAAGHYAAAWRLAAPRMREAFGDSFERFRSDLSSLRRIEFEQVAITERDDASATVEIQSVATHDDRVDRCSGTLRTVRGDRGHWVVEPAGVHCTSE